MWYVVVSTGIVAACVGVLAHMISFVRADRERERTWQISEKELFETGAAAAGKNKPWPKEDNRYVGKNSALAKKLRGAGIATPALVWLCGAGCLCFAAAVCVVVASGILAGGIVAVATTIMGLRAYISSRERKQEQKFDEQFAETLPQIAASVKGSLTLERALRVAIVHMEEPLKEEFVRVLADSAYGMALHEALERMAERTQHADVRTLAAAAKLRQSRGGSMSVALAMISQRVNGRLRSFRELKTEIASTRMAKWFVAAAMPAIFLIMFLTNAEFARFYTQESLGLAMLGLAVLLEIVGLVIAHRVTILEA